MKQYDSTCDVSRLPECSADEISAPEVSARNQSQKYTGPISIEYEQRVLSTDTNG